MGLFLKTLSIMGSYKDQRVKFMPGVQGRKRSQESQMPNSFHWMPTARKLDYTPLGVEFALYASNTPSIQQSSIFLLI